MRSVVGVRVGGNFRWIQSPWKCDIYVGVRQQKNWRVSIKILACRLHSQWMDWMKSWGWNRLLTKERFQCMMLQLCWCKRVQIYEYKSWSEIFTWANDDDETVCDAAMNLMAFLLCVRYTEMVVMEYLTILFIHEQKALQIRQLLGLVHTAQIMPILLFIILFPHTACGVDIVTSIQIAFQVESFVI